MGRLKNNIAAFQTNVALDNAQAAKPTILPIFGKSFEGHGVTYSNATAVRFDGEGEEGWGFHADWTVDCINVTKTRLWNLQDGDGWANFMNMELLPEEVGLKNPAQAVISRLIVTVMMLPSWVQFIPDPAYYAIALSYAGVPTSGVYGTLCPRPVGNEKQREFRMKMAKRRRSIMENCL